MCCNSSKYICPSQAQHALYKWNKQMHHTKLFRVAISVFSSNDVLPGTNRSSTSKMTGLLGGTRGRPAAEDSPFGNARLPTQKSVKVSDQISMLDTRGRLRGFAVNSQRFLYTACAYQWQTATMRVQSNVSGPVGPFSGCTCRRYSVNVSAT